MEPWHGCVAVPEAEHDFVRARRCLGRATSRRCLCLRNNPDHQRPRQRASPLHTDQSSTLFSSPSAAATSSTPHVLLCIDAREQLKPDRGETPRPPLLSCIASARPRRPRRVQDPAGEPWVSLLLFSSSRTRQRLSILSTRKNLARAIRSRSGGRESPGAVHGCMAAVPAQAGSNRLLQPSPRPPMGQPVPDLAQPGFRPRSFPFSFSCILLPVGLQSLLNHGKIHMHPKFMIQIC
jgi:hypothetical protein